MFGDALFTGVGNYCEYVLAEKYRLRIIVCCKNDSVLGYRVESWSIKEGEQEKFVHTMREVIQAYHEYFYVKANTTQKLVLP